MNIDNYTKKQIYKYLENKQGFVPEESELTLEQLKNLVIMFGWNSDLEKFIKLAK